MTGPACAAAMIGVLMATALVSASAVIVMQGAGLWVPR